MYLHLHSQISTVTDYAKSLHPQISTVTDHAKPCTYRSCTVTDFDAHRSRRVVAGDWARSRLRPIPRPLHAGAGVGFLSPNSARRPSTRPFRRPLKRPLGTRQPPLPQPAPARQHAPLVPSPPPALAGGTAHTLLRTVLEELSSSTDEDHSRSSTQDTGSMAERALTTTWLRRGVMHESLMRRSSTLTAPL